MVSSFGFLFVLPFSNLFILLFVTLFLFFRILKERLWNQMQGEMGGTWRSKGRKNYNENIVYEKNLFW